VATYTKLNLKNDVKDSAKEYDITSHAMHAASDELKMSESGLSYQRTEPNQKSPVKHFHTEQEEVYVIISGNGSIVINDEKVPVGPLDAVRVSKEATRYLEAGSEGLEFIVFGAPRTGNDKGIVVTD
jgi:uncharacterized cupin superfamily protein